MMTYYKFEIGSDDDQLTVEDVLKLPQVNCLPATVEEVHCDQLSEEEADELAFYMPLVNDFRIYFDADNEVVYFKVR